MICLETSICALNIKESNLRNVDNETVDKFYYILSLHEFKKKHNLDYRHFSLVCALVLRHKLSVRHRVQS